MGSTARGLITGFICRLCSKMNRHVILIYGEEGERMGLADKINSYLPITVNRHDPLPKTVCLNCVARLENHTHMLQMLTHGEDRFKSQKGNVAANGPNLENDDDDDDDEDEIVDDYYDDEDDDDDDEDDDDDDDDDDNDDDDGGDDGGGGGGGGGDGDGGDGDGEETGLELQNDNHSEDINEASSNYSHRNENNSNL